MGLTIVVVDVRLSVPVVDIANSSTPGFSPRRGRRDGRQHRSGIPDYLSH